MNRRTLLRGALFQGTLGALALPSVPAGRLRVLAEQSRALLVTVAPAGAHWASSWGCGTTIEGVEQSMMVDCGMGHVPAATRRFLYLHDVAVFEGF